MALATAIAGERSVVEAERRGRTELATTLFGGEEAPEEAERRTGRLGVSLGRVRTVLVADGPRGDQVAADAAAAYQGWSMRHAGRAVALLPTDELVPAATSADTSVVHAECAGGAAAVADAYRRAVRGCGLLAALDRRGAWVGEAELGVYAALLAQAAAGSGSAFVRWQLAPRLDHDERRGTELVTTLRAYLREGRRHRAACTALGVHANTLYQRLERITGLLGDDWRTPDRAFELELALRLLALRDRIGEG